MRREDRSATDVQVGETDHRAAEEQRHPDRLAEGKRSGAG